MKNSKVLDRMTPDHPPKKPFQAFMKAEMALFALAIVVGIIAYFVYYRG